MKIAEKLIHIDNEIIITAQLDNPLSYYNNYWFLMDFRVNELKSKEIYVDDIKVDDSCFEIKDFSINIKFENLFNGQFRKIKVIQVMEKEFLDYNFQILILNEQDVLVQFLIYGVDNIIIDDIIVKHMI